MVDDGMLDGYVLLALMLGNKVQQREPPTYLLLFLSVDSKASCCDPLQFFAG